MLSYNLPGWTEGNYEKPHSVYLVSMTRLEEITSRIHITVLQRKPACLVKIMETRVSTDKKNILSWTGDNDGRPGWGWAGG
jgi:hypothetical protein